MKNSRRVHYLLEMRPNRLEQGGESLAENRLYYGAFLDLHGRLCIVVGGGQIAERKVHKLLESGARVRVISPHLSPQLLRWVADKNIEWVQRRYRAGDVSSGWLVFAATNCSEVNREVAREAEAVGRLVNVVDDSEACTLTVPASVHRGLLNIAISTSGSNPSIARKLRQILETDLAQGTSFFQKEIISASTTLNHQ